MNEPTANLVQPAAPQVITAPSGPPPLPVEVAPAADVETAGAAPSPVSRIWTIIGRAAKSFDDWFCGDGRWYLGSAAIHAMAILCLGLIAAAVPVTLISKDVVSFDAADVDRSPPAEMARFELGDPQFDPTALNLDAISQRKAQPIAAQEARHYDDSPEFEEAGGGIRSNSTAPAFGGFGGFSVTGLPGPAGRGGVGIGIGLGNNAGSGGPGEGFGHRGKGHRDALMGSGGGTKASDRAVLAGLDWLARHQFTMGHWSLDFHHQCRGDKCSGTSTIRADSAATAMALLPFLGAGQTHKAKGPYQQTINKGLAWLVAHQSADGNLADGAENPMYSHGLATITLCEAYGLTKDERVGYAARQAVVFIERAQNPETGGWRYRGIPAEYSDTSVFGWQIMALKSAQLAGIPVSTSVLANAQKWLKLVATGPYDGLYCYQPTREATPTMTAVGMLCRQFMRLDPRDQGMSEGKNYLMHNPPGTSLTRDCYYWYYATMTMHNFMDADWDIWNRKMRRVLIESQEREGCALGSWDPDRPTVDTWGTRGGRLMMTSFDTLTLEVYYRYMPLFDPDLLGLNPPANMGFVKPIDKAPEKPADSKTEE
jgi:hypothetical protein